MNVVTFEFLEELEHERHEELLHQKFSRIVCLLDLLCLRILPLLSVEILQVALGVNFIHCIDDVV